MTVPPKRPIFDWIFHLTTGPWLDATVRFKLEGGAMSTAGFFPPDELVVEVAEDGSFEAELWTNTAGLEGTSYLAIVAGRKKYRFSVPPGERVQLTTLILGSEPVEPDQEDLLLGLVDTAIETHNTAETAHADIRAQIAALQLGWRHRGGYQDDTTYVAHDVVELDGSTYVAIATTTSHTPPNATYWRLVAAKGDPGAPGLAGPQGPQGEPGAPGPAGVVAATAPLIYNTETQTLSIAPATSGAAGSMSAADKSKLDGIEAGGIGTTTGDNRYARTSVATTQNFGDPGNAATAIFARSAGYAGLFSSSNVAFSAYTSGGMGAFEVTVESSGDSPYVTATEQRYHSGTPGAGYGTRRRVQLKSTTTYNRDAAYDDTVWTDATDATRTAERRIGLVKNGVLVEVLRLDHNDSAGQAGMLIYHDGTLKRVKVGADGTGPGGSGRALYID